MGFELGTSGVRGKRSTNWAKTTASVQDTTIFFLAEIIRLSRPSQNGLDGRLEGLFNLQLNIFNLSKVGRPKT